ncbi:MAG: glycerol-3-phosphate 1-O-acyltransferase PlsY [bacterium]
MIVTFLVLAAFLLGSVPVGLVIAKLKGVDIRKTGSGNIGATNVLRSIGKKEAGATLLGDIAKGAIPVLLAQSIFGSDLRTGVVGLAAVAGHVFSVFLRFRGAKGVATSLGVLAVYAPRAGLITIALWLVTFAISRISSLSAIVAFLLLPFTTWLVESEQEKAIVTLLIAALIIIRHKDNIKRLVKGEESRVRERS